MQYLLTAREYEDLHKQYYLEIDILKDKLQTACTLAAENTPIVDDDDPMPHGCIRVNDHTEYCDECPVRKICPYERKAYSR